MNTHHFYRINHARIAKEQSPHHTHKVGTLLCLSDNTNTCITSNNNWPTPLLDTIGCDKKLGNASTTIHAETAALCRPPGPTHKAEIYITDLPCPNCAKTITEAGIHSVYIDSNAQNTPLGIKMKPYFDRISMLILKSANTGVYEIDLQAQKITPLFTATQLPEEPHFENTKHLEIYKDNFQERIESLKECHLPFAACIAQDNNGKDYFIGAKTDNALGLSQTNAQYIIDTQYKYEPTLQPFNKLLGQCARYGLQIKDGFVYTSQTPTAREFVNMIGYGITKLEIGTPGQCRDEYGLIALKQLHKYNIMDIITP